MNKNMILTKVVYALTQSELTVVHGESYDDILWGEDVVTIPTEAEVLAECDVVRVSIGFEELRSMRNILLVESDWTQVPDAQVNKVVWAEYRQALRDLPASVIDPFSVVWPIKPEVA